MRQKYVLWQRLLQLSALDSHSDVRLRRPERQLRMRMRKRVWRRRLLLADHPHSASGQQRLRMRFLTLSHQRAEVTSSALFDVYFAVPFASSPFCAYIPDLSHKKHFHLLPGGSLPASLFFSPTILTILYVADPLGLFQPFCLSLLSAFWNSPAYSCFARNTIHEKRKKS